MHFTSIPVYPTIVASLKSTPSSYQPANFNTGNGSSTWGSTSMPGYSSSSGSGYPSFLYYSNSRAKSYLKKDANDMEASGMDAILLDQDEPRSQADVAPQPDKNYSDVLIIHPGSCYVRVGRASDAFPKQCPHLLVRAVKKQTTDTPNPAPQDTQTKPVELPPVDKSAPISPEEHLTDDEALAKPKNQADSAESSDEDNAETRHDPIIGEKRRREMLPELSFSEQAVRDMDEDLKKRVKVKKIRVMPNSSGQVVSFNAQSTPTTIADHNDPYKIEWTKLGQSEVYLGQEAIHMPTMHPEGKDFEYKMFSPILHGLLNTRDYTCLRACFNDMQTIWEFAIESELGIKRSHFSKYNVVLVIPDMFNTLQVEEMVRMESVMGTFGAGLTTACVVDIGGQTTSVACIEDGVCVGHSRYNLKLGGEDITRLFTSLLLENDFPYRELDIQKNYYDWLLMNELKERTCTLNDMELAINVGEFYVRVPKTATRHYKFKIYDDAFKAPMALFFPGVINFDYKLRELYHKNTYLEELMSLRDISSLEKDENKAPTTNKDLNEKSSNSTALLPRALEPLSEVSIPLDIAIARSISRFASAITDPNLATFAPQYRLAGQKDVDDRIRKISSTILLIGGGSMTPHLGHLLEERLSFLMNLENAHLFGLYKTTHPEDRPISVSVLQSPREMDSRMLVWKGASILSKLDVSTDLWVGRREFTHGGLERLMTKSLFMWD